VTVVPAALNAFTLKGSAYKETLRKKLADNRADTSAVAASRPRLSTRILKKSLEYLETVCPPPPLSTPSNDKQRGGD
jgi:hypothetical protein